MTKTRIGHLLKSNYPSFGLFDGLEESDPEIKELFNGQNRHKHFFSR